MMKLETGKLTIPPGDANQKIRDLMFLDDDSLIVVGTSEGKAFIKTH